MTNRKQLGQLETVVLQAISELGEALPAEVLEFVGGGYAYTTVLTVLQRLYRKGMLVRQRVGRAHSYRLASREGLFRRLRERLLGAPTVEVVSHLLESEELSDEELVLLEEKVRRLRGVVGG